MFKKTLLVCAVSLFCTRQGSAAELNTGSVDFDTETLRSLGIDPAVSGYFAEKPRFMPGELPVALKVNGKDKGNVLAQFNEKGELCFSKAFMEQASLRLPDDYTKGCYDYLTKHPQAIINLHPGRDLIELVIPPDEISQVNDTPANFIINGSGALLNYSAMTSRNEYGSASSTYSQLQLDGGINVAGWLLRSQQMLTQTEERFNSENGQTYLQRTLVDLRTTARMGQVSMNNAMLEGTGLYGVTLTPERALEPSESLIRVSGIANTAQARVEVRQQGILLYSTLVPVGPFTLTDVTLRNYSSDLDVTVVETDGSRHSYKIPSSLYLQRIGNPAGLYLSIGRVNDDYDKTPMVISVSRGWRFLSASNATTSAILSRDYQAAALGIDTKLGASTYISLSANQSTDNDSSLQGQRYHVEGSTMLASGVSLTAASTYYTSGYREFSQYVDKDFTAVKKTEKSIGLQWQSPEMGSFNTSFYETKNRNDSGNTRYISVGWGSKIRSSYLSVNWQRQMNASKENGGKEDVFYLNLSIPLGKNFVNSYMRKDKNSSRFGTTLSGNINPDNAYTLSTEAGRNQSESNLSAGLSSNLHYSQLSLNAGMVGENGYNYSGMLQGGVVAHANGVTLSPLPVHETFGVASMAQPVAGIKIETPQGSVWTDSRGYAVLPSLNAWQDSRIEVSTETLPKNMDIGNGTRMLHVGRGAVGNVEFKAITQRRVLLDVTTADGKKLPKNLAVTDEQGNYITTSVDEGVVFLNNASASQTLVVKGDINDCRIQLKLPEQPQEEVFYETAKEVCQ